MIVAAKIAPRVLSLASLRAPPPSPDAVPEVTSPCVALSSEKIYKRTK